MDETEYTKTAFYDTLESCGAKGLNLMNEFGARDEKNQLNWHVPSSLSLSVDSDDPTSKNSIKNKRKI